MVATALLCLALVASASAQMMRLAAVDDLEFDKVLEFDAVTLENDGLLGFRFTAGSACKLKYVELPWALACEIELALDVDEATINNGEPITFSFQTSVVFSQETINNEVDSKLELRYGFRMPEIQFGPDWLSTIGLDNTIDAIAFPPASEMVVLEVPIGDLSEGAMCLLENLPKLTEGFPDVHAIALVVDGISDSTGIEACIKLDNLDIGGDIEDGASFQALFTLHMLDEAHMEGLSETIKSGIVTLRNTLLQRSTPIVMTVNLGDLIRGKATATQSLGSDTTYADVVRADGTFLLGSYAEDWVAPTAAPTAAPTHAPTPLAKLAAGEDEPQGSELPELPGTSDSLPPLAPGPDGDDDSGASALILPLSVGGGAVVLLAAGAALFVTMRRRNASSGGSGGGGGGSGNVSHPFDSPSAVVANPRYEL